MTNLAALRPGKTAVVVDFHVGRGMLRKLDALGLRPGKVVRKLGAQFMAGPVTVVVDGRQLAMGRGIARKIAVRETQ